MSSSHDVGKVGERSGSQNTPQTDGNSMTQGDKLGDLKADDNQYQLNDLKRKIMEEVEMRHAQEVKDLMNEIMMLKTDVSAQRMAVAIYKEQSEQFLKLHLNTIKQIMHKYTRQLELSGVSKETTQEAWDKTIREDPAMAGMSRTAQLNEEARRPDITSLRSTIDNMSSWSHVTYEPYEDVQRSVTVVAGQGNREYDDAPLAPTLCHGLNSTPFLLADYFFIRKDPAEETPEDRPLCSPIPLTWGSTSTAVDIQEPFESTQYEEVHIVDAPVMVEVPDVVAVDQQTTTAPHAAVAFSQLTVQISFDDDLGEPLALQPPFVGVYFQQENVKFVAEQTNAQDHRQLTICAKSDSPMQFAYVAQVRIRTGSPHIPVTKVVDKDVFQFSPFSKPLGVKIYDNGVANVHIEMRFINKIERPHPTFAEGDVVIVFADGTHLTTHKALLAAHSPYMKNILEVVPDGEIVDVSPCTREDFTALLNFIYPTRMPIFKDFKGLIRAALAFQVETVVYACSRYFVDYPDCSFEFKLQEAIKLELVPALEELVYRAYQNGVWNYMVNMGFQPEVFCGPNVYKRIVCPIILKAKSNRFGRSVLSSPWNPPTFFSIVPGEEWMQCSVTVLGTPFYINKGLLYIYGGAAGFPRNQDGSCVATITSDFREACIRANTTPGEVVLSLFTSLYPLSPPVPSRLLRAALIFAHDHFMNIVVEELEQLLLMEPPESAERLLDNFLIAEKYGLDNMKRTNLQRLEGSCQILATELVELPRFNQLSAEMRDKIIDRVCSGWGLPNGHLAKKDPTRNTTLTVTLAYGGPPAPRDESAVPETFQSMLSAEIFGPQHEMMVHPCKAH